MKKIIVNRDRIFYKYHNGVSGFDKYEIKSALNELLEKEQVLFKDKMNWKYPKWNGFKAHQDHCAWNDFNVSYHSLALSGNNSTKENGCLHLVVIMTEKFFNQSNNLGEIEDIIDKELNWKYEESTPPYLHYF